jgi:DNA-binding response OmpR family regulator
MSQLFLLLDGAEDNAWKAFLEEALAPLGKLSVAQASQGMPIKGEEPDGIIIIDATIVEDVERLVSSLRAERPERRIVVMTASPTWQRARAAFDAGAVDYLPKTLSQDELRNKFEYILNSSPPPWPEYHQRYDQDVSYEPGSEKM